MPAEALSVENKAAVLLASLDQNIAAAVLKKLSPTIMNRVVKAMRNLDVVPREVQNSILSDSARQIVELNSGVQGNDSMVTSLLTQVVGEEKALSMMQDETSPALTYSNLDEIAPEQIAGLLESEQPAIVSVVLRYLSPDKSAALLNLLPAKQREEAMIWLCTTDPPSPEVAEKVEKFMEKGLGADDAKSLHQIEKSDKLENVTRILVHLNKTVEDEVLAAIGQKSEETAETIRDRLFTFNNILRLGDDAIKRILSEVDMSALAMALRGVSKELKEKFFSNMSKRASGGIKEEMEYSKKLKVTEVEKRQREIVNIIRTLEADGQISTAGAESEEYV